MNRERYSLASNCKFRIRLSQFWVLINIFIDILDAKTYRCTESSISSTNWCWKLILWKLWISGLVWFTRLKDSGVLYTSKRLFVDRHSAVRHSFLLLMYLSAISLLQLTIVFPRVRIICLRVHHLELADYQHTVFGDCIQL